MKKREFKVLSDILKGKVRRFLSSLRSFLYQEEWEFNLNSNNLFKWDRRNRWELKKYLNFGVHSFQVSFERIRVCENLLAKVAGQQPLPSVQPHVVTQLLAFRKLLPAIRASLKNNYKIYSSVLNRCFKVMQRFLILCKFDITDINNILNLKTHVRNICKSDNIMVWLISSDSNGVTFTWEMRIWNKNIFKLVWWKTEIIHIIIEKRLNDDNVFKRYFVILTSLLSPVWIFMWELQAPLSEKVRGQNLQL